MTRRPARAQTPEHPELDRTLRRRGFLGVAAGATAATLLGGTMAQAATGASPAPSGGHGRHPIVPRGKLGIQLYTVRDQIQALGFAAVFKELNRYGYDSVEFAGYTQGTGDLSLRQLKRLLRDHGLRGIGSHVGYYSDNPADYTFATQLDKVVDDAAALGLPHVGTAASPDRYGRTVDAWKRAAEDFNTYGAAARKRGLKFYQHNHQMEFGFAEDKPNVRLYDVLLAETDPELVYLEMDIYWAFAGQHRFSVRADGTPAPFNPVDYVLAAPHRYPLFHVKDGEHDEASADGYHMVDVGDGDIDYEKFIGTVLKRGHHGSRGRRADHDWLMERDDAVDPEANPAGSLTSARRSAAYLRRKR
ncbi:sugar phosphate isomerase/epimerase [Streptomyces sp. NBC_01775]|uniref:sugar phosphate isomerase/epimerase family protein n=1 Tax=Streptomyces sp. NBC_01775 TaxID=2975939 RepID=UPI002DD9A4DD|nr:sugar phosphate isomerase/epimerase [Streptomyces sp. NBC_01775]WSB75819.1 sugar phosphate isomerase/epimerase [Streptomyces sp. NBC_01775]